MANDLRSRLKATPIKKLKARIDEDNAMLNNGNAEFLNLEDGKLMKIRIFPAHPDHDNFYAPRKCYWLPFRNDSGDNYRGTVLDSIFHGKTEYDIVQEYVAYVKSHCSEEAIAAVTASRDGLLPSLSWLCYAAEVTDGEMVPKMWEFKKTVRDAMNRLAIMEDDDDPIEVDPFTDPDEGFPLFVKYLKNPNKKKGETYYDVSLGKKPKPCPLTDEAIEKFMKLKPIDEVTGSYGIDQFERALEGLQNFDEDNEINVFEDDDWLEIVEKVRSQYKGGDGDDAPKKKVTKKSSKRRVEEEDDDVPSVRTRQNRPGVRTVDPDEVEDDDLEEEDAPEEEGDELDNMTRSELKKFIVDNELSDVVPVFKSTSDDEIRRKIREALDLPQPGAEEPEEQEEEEEEEAPKPKKPVKKAEPEPEPEEAEDPESEEAEERPSSSKAARSLATIRSKLNIKSKK